MASKTDGRIFLIVIVIVILVVVVVAVARSKPSAAVLVLNRETGNVFVENNPLQYFQELVFESLIARTRVVNTACGVFADTTASATVIPTFVKRNHINMQDFQPQAYNSFNEFFTRQLVPGARPFASTPFTLPAFAEGRYLAYAFGAAAFSVKGTTMDVGALLGDATEAAQFVGGPMFIARLSPVDYHRFHFPDLGQIVKSYSIDGLRHSVSATALAHHKDVLSRNERVVTILDTLHFGRLAYVEVGAMCVGRIVQTHPQGVPFVRGGEKGYFLFGGSTVILIGRPNIFVPDRDLLSATQSGVETFVKLGTQIGERAGV